MLCVGSVHALACGGRRGRIREEATASDWAAAQLGSTCVARGGPRFSPALTKKEEGEGQRERKEDGLVSEVL